MKNKKKLVGIYPGTFDPITFGHLDIVNRATHIVDNLIISVADNKHKKPFFSLQERISMVKDSTTSIKNNCIIKVVGFDNLLVEHAKNFEAQVIIRGLRAVADFEYEFQLANMNRALNPEVESLFLTPAEKFSYVSSSLVSEIASLNGDVSKFVTPNVENALKEKFSNN